jgi:hypothetical protein
MQQYAQAAKGLIANISKDLKELNLRLPDVLTLQPAAADPLGASAAGFPAATQRRTATPTKAGAGGPAGGARRSPGAAGVEERAAAFKEELLASRVDLRALRRLAFCGVPDRDGLRAITWKVGGRREARRGARGRGAVADAKPGLRPECATARRALDVGL